jgi:hypothetical protein
MALASDLAAAFSLIQQQQAIEERKEERSQDLALALLGMEMKEDLTERAYEIEASKSMYNENMKIYSDAQEALNVLETQYSKAVGDVDSLGGLYKAAGNEVVRDLYEGEATNYNARAEWALNNANQVKGQIKTLQETLYGDIKKAENIMAGGGGFRGGVAEDKWDLGDIGIVAYELEYGEASPTIQSLFKNNTATMNESLTKLMKTEKAFALTDQKVEYYEKKTESSKVQSENDKAELLFGTLVNSSKKTSGIQNLEALQLAASGYDPTDTSEGMEATREANEKGQFAIYKSIGEDFSRLIGMDADPGDYPDITQEYIEMINLGSGDAASLMGKTAYGNWSVFKGYVDEAAKEYVAAIQSDDSEKAKILTELAQKYFGMQPGVSLTQFAADIGDQYSKTFLASLGSNGLISTPVDTTGVNDNIIINTDNDTEWEDLLDEQR